VKLILAALLAAVLLRYVGLAFVPVVAVLAWRWRGWRGALAVALTAVPVLAWNLIPVLAGRGPDGALSGGPTMPWLEQVELTFYGLGALVVEQVGGVITIWILPAAVAVLTVLIWSAVEGSRAAWLALAYLVLVLVASAVGKIGGHATRLTAVLWPLVALVLAGWAQGARWRAWVAGAVFAIALITGLLFLTRAHDATIADWFVGGNLW
jgi:hypothetical protein